MKYQNHHIIMASVHLFGHNAIYSSGLFEYSLIINIVLLMEYTDNAALSSVFSYVNRFFQFAIVKHLIKISISFHRKP